MPTLSTVLDRWLLDVRTFEASATYDKSHANYLIEKVTHGLYDLEALKNTSNETIKSMIFIRYRKINEDIKDTDEIEYFISNFVCVNYQEECRKLCARFKKILSFMCKPKQTDE